MATNKKREVNEVAKVQQSESWFSKEQIVASEKYRRYRDLVEALLDDEKKYTFTMVDSRIEEYRKGKVK